MRLRRGLLSLLKNKKLIFKFMIGKEAKQRLSVLISEIESKKTELDTVLISANQIKGQLDTISNDLNSKQGVISTVESDVNNKLGTVTKILQDITQKQTETNKIVETVNKSQTQIEEAKKIPVEIEKIDSGVIVMEEEIKKIIMENLSQLQD